MRTFIFILIAVIWVHFSMAQTITVTEQKTSFSTGRQNALVTTVYHNSKIDVIDKWKSFLKDFKNEKVKYNDDELFADDVIIKDMDKNPSDIYTRFEENKKDKSVKMMVALDMSSSYLSSDGDSRKYLFMEKLLKDFALRTSRAPLEEKLNSAQNILKELEETQKDMESNHKNLQNDIEDYKTKLKKSEDAIEKNEENMAKKKTEIEAQKSILDHARRDLEGVN